MKAKVKISPKVRKLDAQFRETCVQIGLHEFQKSVHQAAVNAYVQRAFELDKQISEAKGVK